MISSVNNSNNASLYKNVSKNKQTAASDVSFEAAVKSSTSTKEVSPATSNTTDSSPLFAVLYPPENSFYVYKAGDHTEENPTYFVVGKDKGKDFEITINANDVKSNQASMIEMTALQLHLKEKGVINDIVLHPYEVDQNNYPTERNLFEKRDVISVFKEMYTRNSELKNPDYDYLINLEKIMSALDSK